MMTYTQLQTEAFLIIDRFLSDDAISNISGWFAVFSSLYKNRKCNKALVCYVYNNFIISSEVANKYSSINLIKIS